MQFFWSNATYRTQFGPGIPFEQPKVTKFEMTSSDAAVACLGFRHNSKTWICLWKAPLVAEVLCSQKHSIICFEGSVGVFMDIYCSRWGFGCNLPCFDYLEVPDIENLRSESFNELIVQKVSCTSTSPQFAGEFSELPSLPVTKGALGLYIFMIIFQVYWGIVEYGSWWVLRWS